MIEVEEKGKKERKGRFKMTRRKKKGKKRKRLLSIPFRCPELKWDDHFDDRNHWQWGKEWLYYHEGQDKFFRYKFTTQFYWTDWRAKSMMTVMMVITVAARRGKNRYQMTQDTSDTERLAKDSFSFSLSFSLRNILQVKWVWSRKIGPLTYRVIKGFPCITSFVSFPFLTTCCKWLTHFPNDSHKWLFSLSIHE